MIFVLYCYIIYNEKEKLEVSNLRKEKCAIRQNFAADTRRPIRSNTAQPQTAESQRSGAEKANTLSDIMISSHKITPYNVAVTISRAARIGRGAAPAIALHASLDSYRPRCDRLGRSRRSLTEYACEAIACAVAFRPLSVSSRGSLAPPTDIAFFPKKSYGTLPPRSDILFFSLRLRVSMVGGDHPLFGSSFAPRNAIQKNKKRRRLALRTPN
ncbi:hypothetical protein EVAR_82047_1 [Eumeta japonica]|uniref:Uncharacterized protein n=1 Tax=Eumeta variegata TaxID=151549 RepID=A0A4C1XN57_EUMVA|nr:hypothetical protein EVAR_82047_1 [Eumeta japonica]